MSPKKLYRLYNKETGKTIAWFTDSEDMWYLDEWYDKETDYDKYELIE